MRRFRETVLNALREEEQTGEPALFALLPVANNRKRSFAVSSLANIVALVLLLIFSLTHLPRVKPTPVEATALTFELQKPHLPRVPRVKVVAPSPKTIARLAAPKIPSQPQSVAPIRSVKVGAFASVPPTVVANIRNAPTIKVGAFGNPMGARVNPYVREASLRAPVLGTFGGVGGATGAGSGSPRRGAGGGAGGVQVGGFGTSPGGGGGSFSRPVQAVTQPVTVTYSVKPVYTSEAHAAGVQGEVVLRVRFAANGRVEILSVVQPLGHGLDQSAENAVRQYRFTPAIRNGQAVDQTTIVHVRFQLA